MITDGINSVSQMDDGVKDKQTLQGQVNGI